MAAFILSSPVQEKAVALPLAEALEVAAAVMLANCLSFYFRSFLCDGQGDDRQAVLYKDRSC